MLQLLHIENIAVIEKADVEFGRGLNVLTGETGAGKSIVIDALSAISGGRVSRELVRSGAKAAMVTAVFTPEGAIMNWCRENDMEPEEGEDVFIQRKISVEGKSSCRINGMPVSATLLRELGAHLIDIHGQNDGRKLLDEGSHRSYLDGFGGLGSIVEEYKRIYKEYRDKEKEISALTMDENEKQRRMDILHAQIEELETANIKPGEQDKLSARRDLLSNASKLIDAVDGAFYALYGSEDSDGAVALISEAESLLSGASRYSDELLKFSERLGDLMYTGQDVAEELREFRESLDFSPGELDELEERLALLKRLSKKYGDEQEMLEYLEKARAELDDIEYSDDRLVKLEGELKKLWDQVLSMAKKLSDKRRKVASALEKRIIDELSQLSMPKVRFAVDIETMPDAEHIGAFGCDEVRFLMSANQGETPGRISKIASGGELSRIMLALKNVLTENDDIGVMVFDEIDTGVSGVAAQRVGEKLSDLARQRQVLCVTHLPQIAAMADSHFEISKSEKSGRTYTQVAPLDEQGRKRELARLTGGDNISETTLSAASEQLEAAKKYKQSKSGSSSSE